MKGVERPIDAGRQEVKSILKEEFAQDTWRGEGGLITPDPGKSNNHSSAIGKGEEAMTAGGRGVGVDVTRFSVRQRPPPEREDRPQGRRARGSSDWGRHNTDKWNMGQ